MTGDENDGLWTVEKAMPEELVKMLPSMMEGSDPNLNFYMFLHLLQQLKRTKRTGWILYDVKDSESISDHMYRMGVIGFFANKELDSGRCIKIAIVHDIAEAVVGDITPFDGITKGEKHRREKATIEYLRDLVAPVNTAAAQEIYDLWNEYENIESPEARFVKDVDKFEFMVQCLEEERRHDKKIDMGQCMSVRELIKTPQVSEWADGILKQRELYWSTK